MKRIVCLFLMTILLASAIGCGGGSQNDKFYTEADPIQVMDGAGRKVSFPKPVNTVATTWGGTIDPYLFALGVQDRLVATNAKNDFHQMLVPDMAAMKSVGRWAVDKEALASVSPELFIHGLGGLDQLKTVNKLGVRGIVLNMNTFDDVKYNITMLGAVFGVEERAAAVNAYCDGVLSLIEARISQLPEEKKVTVVVLGEQVGYVASDIYDTIEEMVRFAGGKSVVPEDIATKTEYTNVGLETIFKWNADFMFLQSNWGEMTDEQILTDPAWANLTSVRNGHVYALPTVVDSWGTATPSCCLGALFMSMQMYPELYKDVDYEQVVLDFYRNVYGLETTREQIGF